jgi:hypothetical protein
MAVIRLACVGTISNKAMSKNGSEDVVMEEQGDGPATAMAPSPGYGSIKIRHMAKHWTIGVVNTLAVVAQVRCR